MRLLATLSVCLVLVMGLGLLACSSDSAFGPSAPAGVDPDPDPPDPCDDSDDCDGNCDPRTQGYWSRQCRSFDPQGPGPHPDWTLEELEAMFETTDPILAGVSEPDQSTCEALEADPANEPCERALKQYAAVLLNVESEFVSDCSVLEFEDGTRMTAAEAITMIGDLIRPQDPDGCKEAADLAVQINEGTACTGETQDPDDGTCFIRVVAPDDCNSGKPYITLNGWGFCNDVVEVTILGAQTVWEVKSDSVIQVEYSSAPCGCDPPETGDTVVTLGNGESCSLDDSFTCD